MNKEGISVRTSGSAPSKKKRDKPITKPSKKKKHSQSVERTLKKHVKNFKLMKEENGADIYLFKQTPIAESNRNKSPKKKKHHQGNGNIGKPIGNDQLLLGSRPQAPHEKMSRKKKKRKFEPLTELLLDEGFEYRRSSDAENFSDLSLFFKNESVDKRDCKILCGPLMCSSNAEPPSTVVNANDTLEPVDQSVTINGQDLLSIETPFVTENQIELMPKQNKTIKFHKISNSDQFLLQMKHPTSLFFQGELKVKVVLGSLEILGCTLTCRKKQTTIFSPGGSSLLSLQTVFQNTAADETGVTSLLDSLGMTADQIRHIVSSLNTEGGDCLVVVNKAHCNVSSYLSHCSIYLYPRTNDVGRKYFKEESILHCEFETNKDKISRCYSKPESWDDIVDGIVEEAQTQSPTRVMVCGGKSVGKSTLLRFMINKSLSHFKEILFLDFDPGQAEFSVPGSVSVVRVSSPLLGPNFTHLLDQERMVYVGDVNVGNCPDRYMKSVDHIIEYCHSIPEFKQMVWFVNTMGFSKGLGVELTTSLIRMVNPSRLIQIQSQSAKRNFPDLLTPDYVRGHPGRWHEAYLPGDREPSYEFLTVASAAEKKQHGVSAEWGLQPKTARDIVVLSYINKMLEPPRFSLTDVIPSKTSFARLMLSVCNESVHYSQFLSIMNGNLVALCVVPEADDDVLHPNVATMPRVLVQPPVAPCLGFGVVRGVDLAEGAIYIISPLSEEQLKTVNCLVKGTVMLPACVYTDFNRGLGHVPYVAVGPGQVTSKGIARRFFHPLKN